MSELFILQNQDNLFLGKQKEWLDGRDAAALYKTPYKDEAINQMFEVSSKDYTQRIKVVSCSASEKGLPAIPEDLLPPPLPKVVKKTAEERRNIAAFVALDDAESFVAPLSEKDVPAEYLSDDDGVADSLAEDDLDGL